MNADLEQNAGLAFAELFRSSFARTLSSQCGSVWQATDNPTEDAVQEQSEPFHAIFSFEGTLNGDLHLKLASTDALALASALLGKVSEAMDDAERDAITEFLDAAIPDFCESAATAHGIFTGSLTVTATPPPATLESHTLSIAGGGGIVRLEFQVAADLSAALAEASLPQPEPEAAPTLVPQPEPEEAEPEKIETFYEMPESRPEERRGRSESLESVNLELVLDVELNVTLRFGQRQLTLREVLELTSGSVVELDRQVEEPVELLLEGKVIARGEAVVIDGNYGLRITEVPQPFTPTMLR